MGIDDDVVTDALSLGIKHFKNQNYQKLLKVFSKAINLASSYDILELHKKYQKLVHPKLSILLDSRALTYEKLGDYKKLGKDGEDLIELDRFNSKGYLRVSKILLILDKDIDAYKVLTKGFKRITAEMDQNGLKRSANFDQLVQQRKNLAKSFKRNAGRGETDDHDDDDQQHMKKKIKLEPKRSHDPMMIFPVEIIKMILLYIPFKQICKMMTVCKKWGQLISNIPELWDYIQIDRPISSNSFKNFYNTIILANKGRYNARVKYMQILPRRMDERRIMNIILNFTKFQIHGLQIVLQDFDLRELLISLTSSKLTRYNFHFLKILKIECDVYLRFENYIFELLPNLNDLEIIIPKIKQAQNILERERDSELLQNLSRIYDLSTKIYQNMTNLSIIYKQNIGSSILPFQTLLLNKQFPNLSKLTIVGFKIQDLKIFDQPELKQILLEQNPELTLINFLNETRSQFWETLYFREFKVSTSMGQLIGANQISHPLGNLCHLKHLDLTGCSLNFDELIKILNLTDKNLQTLNIGACPNLIWQSSGFERSSSGRNRIVDFNEIINCCPILVELSLNQSTNLNDFTLKSMSQTILLNFDFYRLGCLDLSFNNITGHGLIEFFQKLSLSSLTRIKLGKLIVDGNDIKTETLEYLKKLKVVDHVQYEYNRKSWRHYGVNSYSPSV